MATTTLVNVEQFGAMPDRYDSSGNRIKEQLIAGEIVSMPPPSQGHDVVKNNVNEAVLAFLLQHTELGLRSGVEIAYQLSSENVFVPDASVVVRSRILARGSGWVSGAPEIAIEVISPSDTARHVNIKTRAYLSSGAQAVWVLYPETGTVVVHGLDGIKELKGDEILTAALLPGFSVPVSKLFE